MSRRTYLFFREAFRTTSTTSPATTIPMTRTKPHCLAASCRNVCSTAASAYSRPSAVHDLPEKRRRPAPRCLTVSQQTRGKASRSSGIKRTFDDLPDKKVSSGARKASEEGREEKKLGDVKVEDLLPPNPILDQFYKNRDIRVPSQVQYQIVGAALRHCNDPRAYPLSQMEEDIAALTTDLTTVGDIGFLVGRHAWFDAGPAVARALMDKPARSGDEFAAYNLARIMSTDHPHSNRNLQAAMKIFRELADKNHAGAQFKVGERMVKAHDIPGGMKMLEKSAANGHAEAAVYLGVFYKDGFKNWVSVDRVKAMKYLRQAHDAGNPEASYHISVMYSFGQHDPSGQPDHWKSFAFLTIAANAGIPRAQHNLGICYMVPPALEIPYDPFLGVQYLSMAADQNLMPSLINLARLYLYGNLKGKVYPDYGVAENYLKRAFAITQNDRDKYFIYGPEVEGLMEDMRRLIKGEVLSMDPVVLGAKKAVDE